MKQYDCIYFMGDSWTVAQGQYEDLDKLINFENRWTALVAKHFNLKEINPAIAGCGNKTIFHKVYKDIYELISEGIRPLVVVSYTDPNRVELWNPKFNKIEVLSPAEIWEKQFYKTYLTLYDNHDENISQSMYYILSIKTLLERHNLDYIDNWAFTPVLENKYFNTNTQLEQTLVDIAGDEGRFPMPNSDPTPYGHANVYGNQKIANKIIEQISKLYDT